MSIIQVVLHDWSDGEVERIVANVAAAMRPGDRYYILEGAIQV